MSVEPIRYVYFVQADELRLIKIGVADRLEKRLRDLSHASPDKLVVLGAQRCDRGGELETELHQMFAADRVRGEWFDPTDELTRYIERYATLSEKALARLNAVVTFPTMPRGRPTKAMMRAREVAGIGKWL